MMTVYKTVKSEQATYDSQFLAEVEMVVTTVVMISVVRILDL